MAEELPESMMVVVDIVGEAKQQIDEWLGCIYNQLESYRSLCRCVCRFLFYLMCRIPMDTLIDAHVGNMNDGTQLK